MVVLLKKLILFNSRIDEILEPGMMIRPCVGLALQLYGVAGPVVPLLLLRTPTYMSPFRTDARHSPRAEGVGKK